MYKQREGGVSSEEQEGEMGEVHSNCGNDCIVYLIDLSITQSLSGSFFKDLN